MGVNKFPGGERLKKSVTEISHNGLPPNLNLSRRIIMNQFVKFLRQELR
jgi:hypothetical protein